MTAIRVADFLKEPPPSVLFLARPLIPVEGSVLLYGKTSIGKSPFVWELARSVAGGEPFLGLPTTQTNVLFIELDTPRPAVYDRLAHLSRDNLSIPENWWLLPHGAAFNILNPLDSFNRQCEREAGEREYGLIIVNTLRRCHNREDIGSDVPSAVYSAWAKLFPRAARVFVHHEHKTREHDTADEAFSGSGAWLNDAQVGIHLIQQSGGLLTVVNTKNQYAERLPNLLIELAHSNTTVTLSRSSIVPDAFAKLDPHVPKTQRVELVAKQLGLAKSTVWKALSAQNTEIGSE